MSRILKILAPARYPWRFNGPRQSRHAVSIRSFVPFNKISPNIEGITVFNPFPLKNFDLVHAFNRIPLGLTPFIIGFESHLPRAFGLEHSRFFHDMARMLAGKRCKAIVAISDYARRQFLLQHEGRPWRDALAAKLSVRYPNIPIPPGLDMFTASTDGTVRLLFVGNHFARKGGLVALRLAELAYQRGFPIALDIVSSVDTGAVSWTDPLRPGYFDRYNALLRTLPNVRHHGSLPNDAVLSKVRNAHFLLLPTFSDSFGFSALEAMANYTPVIATTQGALPEFIENNVNGILLSLETDAAGEWKHIGFEDRHSSAYEALVDNEIERLAEEAYIGIAHAGNDVSAYLPLRQGARAAAQKLFSADAATEFWDDFYYQAVAQ